MKSGSRNSNLRLPAQGVSNGETADLPPAAAMLPAELLQPDEIIILLLKPSPWFIVLAPLRTLAVIALATFGLLVAQAYPPLGAALELGSSQIILLGLAAMALRLFWQFLEWLSRFYVLTDQRVIRVKGVLRVSIFEAPLRQIQHTRMDFSIRERIAGLGSIGFATAGTGFVEAFWTMVANPLEVHRKVLEALRRYRR